MKYDNMILGEFLSRPNRFIANVLIDGKEEVVHVKNTGRCKELLISGVNIFLQDCESSSRKTRYDLISVYKGGRLINMDSQVPNLVVEEWLLNGGFFDNIHFLKREQKFGNSRLDFYVEYGSKKAYIEVKGVTLEHDNIAMFPDAPTTRGAKHIMELIEAKTQGYEAYVIFVIQMKGVAHFTPNEVQDPAFAKVLKEASKKGVNILAFDCTVTKDSISYNSMVKVVI